MTMEQEQERNAEYNDYVEQVTPVHNIWANTGKAFLLGGAICVLGQCITNFAASSFGLEKEDAALWCSLILVLLSVILTACNVYAPLANWGGAGALVPITGFANGVASSAIEFQKEGQVFGIGCQIFRIAGPVILYGIFSSWVLGLLYWIGKCFGWF
ncbi:MAG: SpoVA/SpoVAEb family sporulation membrane protein [Blautia sp.]|nr:SpoVA/SpoVAEb family sporulation membrane protein [Blautia sp.]MCM1283810.1 SpoVA/SpoVAEb family sporulation membrane protein [Roseburia sp.]